MGYLLAFCAAIMWGLYYALMQTLSNRFSNRDLFLFNILFNILFILPIVAPAFQNLRAATPREIGLLFISNILIACGGVCMLFAIRKIGSATANMIEISYPLFTIIFVMLMYREKFDLTFWTGVVLMLTGALFVIGSRH